jgi:hypothetical protein
VNDMTEREILAKVEQRAWRLVRFLELGVRGVLVDRERELLAEALEWLTLVRLKD